MPTAEGTMPNPAPLITGLLETSVYAEDVKATAGFYRDLFGFTALVQSPRLVAFEVAERHVLLVFQRGATEADVTDGRGTIPGHDGSGRLHRRCRSPRTTSGRGGRASPSEPSRSPANTNGRGAERASIFVIPMGLWWSSPRRACGGERRREIHTRLDKFGTEYRISRFPQRSERTSGAKTPPPAEDKPIRVRVRRSFPAPQEGTRVCVGGRKL